MKKVSLFSIIIFILIFILILATSIYAQQITPQFSGLGTSGSLSPFHMVAVDKDIVWATCSNPNAVVKEMVPNLITHTIDGGATWKVDTLPADTPNEFYVACIHAIGKDSAWVSCIDKVSNYNSSLWEPKIYATCDGGNSWVVQNIVFSSSYGGQIHFFDHLEGVIFAGNSNGYFQVFKTNDAGNNWKRLPESNFPKIQSENEFGSDDGYYVIEDTIWIGTKGRILKSTDRGTTWTACDTPLSEKDYIIEVTFSDSKHGIARYMNSFDYNTKNMIVTTDGGKNWSLLTPQGLANKVYDLNSIPDKPGAFLCTSYFDHPLTSNELYYSNDNGTSWSKLGQINVPGRITLFNSEIGWISEIASDTPDVDVYKIEIK